MEIQFEATIDEVIDVYERALQRTESFTSQQRRSAIINTFVGAISAGVSAFFVSKWFGFTTIIALLVALFGAFVGSIVPWGLPSDRVRKQLRVYFREQYGDRETLPFDIEISESGISIKHLGSQHTFEWSNIEELRETEDNIEFYIYGGAATFVKKKAFSSTDTKQKFIENVEQFLNTSRTSSNWLNEA